ncbi:secretogranin-3-like [Ptychodera flava]|uniref:secretogranin-3-like n=1 Tax=Ptychodera flava TaxID=63121 RepID=UPI00396A80E8
MKTLLAVFLFFTVFNLFHAAPVKESEDIKEIEIPAQINEDLPQDKIVEEALDEAETSGGGSGDEPEIFLPPSKEIEEGEEDNINEEKTNYEDFGIDYDSFEKNKNTVDTDERLGGDRCDIDFDTARELAANMANPAAIADYIITTNDIESFVCVIQILVEDSLLSEEEANYLEEEVSNELQRQLYDDATYYSDGPYGDEVNEVAEEEPDVVYPDLDDVITADMDELLYDLAETLYRQPPGEKQSAERALVQFAGIIAREVVLGNLSPEDGEGYLDILAQLPYGQVLDQGAGEEDEVPLEDESETDETSEDVEEIEEEETTDPEEEEEMLDDLEAELLNSAKYQGNSKLQDTFYPEDGKFGAFPEYKDNYLDNIREDIVWLEDYGLLPTDEEEALEEGDPEAAQFGLNFGDMLDEYVKSGKLSEDDADGIRNLLN